MAKTEYQEQPDISAAEIAELDEIASASIHNQGEILSFDSDKAGRKVQVTRGQVYRYASVMSSNGLIADLIGIDKITLQKHFPRELKMGRAFARQKLLTRFYHLALYGNNPADRLFALKNWANMSDNGLKEELEEVDDGVEFKVRRPQRAVESLKEQERRDEYLNSFKKAETLPEATLESNEEENETP